MKGKVFADGLVYVFFNQDPLLTDIVKFAIEKLQPTNKMSEYEKQRGDIIAQGAAFEKGPLL